MLLAFENVKKAYHDGSGDIPVLRGVSFSLDAGQSLALTGDSGSGKSTLLHIAGGLEAADAGRVHVAGQEVTGLDDRGRSDLRRSQIALVFQQFNLIPSLTVAANIGFHAALTGRDDPARIERLVAALGLQDQLHKYPEALSGGQQQRVAIARALAARPKLLLADEPTGNLDEATAEDVIEQMLALVALDGTGLMVVTHSAKVATRMDRRLRLSGGLLE
ncbi:MAG: ABC transporter ATP-binding protein [Pseudomonadota bacterium]